MHTTSLTIAMRQTAAKSRTAYETLQLHTDDHGSCERYNVRIMMQVRERQANEQIDRVCRPQARNERVCDQCFMITSQPVCQHCA